MKNLILISILFLSVSCATRLGDLTMISTRNVDSKIEYKELKRGVKATGKDLETAIDKATKEATGGEFLKNVVVYWTGNKIKVEGDVWGIEGILTEKQKEASQDAEKFSIGDKVTWSDGFLMVTGEVAGKDKEIAIVKSASGRLLKVKYSKLTKIE